MSELGSEARANRESLIALPLLLLAFSAMSAAMTPRGLSAPDEQYVYYAYIPSSVANMSKAITFGLSDSTDYVSTVYNYTSFPSYLELVGTDDATSYELLDLGSKTLLRSGILSKYQHVRIPFGARITDTKPFEVQDYYMKLVTSKPVSALLWGGFIWGIPGFDRPYPENMTSNGFSSFVPCVDGGFIGKEFVFLTFPTYWELKGGIPDVNKYNIFAIQNSKVSVYDAAGNLVEELEVGKLSMGRTAALQAWNVYRISSSGNILVYGTTENSMTYLPSLTGGYVGKSFVATKPGSWMGGDVQGYIALALQDAKVEFYDMRKPAGSSPDKVLQLTQGELAFDSSFQSHVPLAVRSTGNITLLVGGNSAWWGSAAVRAAGYIIPQYIAQDTALLGATPGQQFAFYAPYQAIIFAADDTEIEINGIPRTMKKDEFVRLTSGPYVAKPRGAPVIVEVMGDITVSYVFWRNVNTPSPARDLRKGFNDWGQYLIPVQALYRSYAPIEQGGGTDILLYAGLAAVAVAAVLGAVALTKRRKAH